MSDFKTYTKSHGQDIENVCFVNGQKVFTVYAARYTDGTIEIQVEDGAGRLMVEWEDYEEVA